MMMTLSRLGWHRVARCALVVVGVGATGLPTRAATRGPAVPPLPGWIAGCWEARTATDTLEEYWTAPRGGMMLGVSRLVHAGAVVEYEEDRIERRDARIVFVSQPSSESKREYAEIEAMPNEVRFDSPGDVAEQIRYERRADTLRVRFSRRASGTVEGVESPMTLVACPHT